MHLDFQLRTMKWGKKVLVYFITLSKSKILVSIEKVLVNDELGRTWKHALVVSVKALLRNLRNFL